MSEDIGSEVTGTRLGAGETAQRTLLAGGGVLGGFLLRRWARLAETSGESRQSQARTSVRGAPTQSSAVWTRPAGEPPKVNQR